MSSPITSNDFDNQNVSASLCDSFQEKLLNNDKMKELLDYLFLSSDGSIAKAFSTDLFLSMFGQFIGEIKFYPVLPTGLDSDTMLKAEGQQVSTITYARLFARYGTTFNLGGDTAPSDVYPYFRLPDARSCYLLGAGTNTEYVPGSINALVSSHVGAKESSNTLIAANLPAHKHEISIEGANGVVSTSQLGRLLNANWNAAASEDKVAYTRDTVPPTPVTPIVTPTVPPSLAGVYYIVANIKIGGVIL